MPQIKLKHIVSCSSEETKHKAENLLKPETYYKWKCVSGEEKNASVVIQLEQSSKIHSIDIGNNGSAFIEVLVGQSTWDPSKEFQVLLVASSFMSPSESKSGKNVQRVRMFGPENLNKAAADQKWDRIKLVCTQPYNRDHGYGISFITLHSQVEKSEQTPPQSFDTTKIRKVGSFTLRDESDDKFSVGSFFARKNQINAPPSVPLSLAATARDASQPSKRLLNVSSDKNTIPVVGALKTSRSLSPPRAKRKSTSTPEMKRTQSDIPDEVQTKVQPDTSGVTSKKELEETFDHPPSKKLKVSTDVKKQKRSKKKVPYHKILKGVILALSGYQNPERGKVRDKAMSMGAEYRPDWAPGCTHLICAFRNTPKFIQVKGKGKIVTKAWINDCAKQQTRLPVKSYRIDGGGSSSSYSGSDDEVEEEAAGSTACVAEDDATPQEEESSCKPHENAKAGGSSLKKDGKSSSSECDTMDELEKARKVGYDDPYAGSTEEDENLAQDAGRSTKKTLSVTNLPDLPDFFANKHFFLYGDFEDEEKRLITRYITAYNGVCEDYMHDTVNYVITNEKWDENFDQALKDNATLTFVRPVWIFKCHETGNLLDCEPFSVTQS